MESFEKIIWTLIFLLTLILYSKLIDKIISKLKTDDSDVPFNYNALSRKDLGNMQLTQFVSWCSEFLKYKGFSNIQVNNNDTSIICSFGNEMIYVKCLLFKLDDDNIDDKCPEVKLTEIQGLLGLLAHEKISKGLLITNGNISNKASQFTISIPEPFQIKFIDGCELVNGCRELYDSGLVINIE